MTALFPAMCCVYVYKPLEFYSFSFSIVIELFLAQLAAAHSHSPLTREHESFHSLKNNVEVPNLHVLNVARISRFAVFSVS